MSITRRSAFAATCIVLMVGISPLLGVAPATGESTGCGYNVITAGEVTCKAKVSPKPTEPQQPAAPAQPGGGSGNSGGGASASPVPVDSCTYEKVSAEKAATLAPGANNDLTDEPSTSGQSQWYVKKCPGGGVTVYRVTPGETPAPAAAPEIVLPSAEELARQAVASVSVVTPPVVLDPFYQLEDGRRGTLKNIETWLWIDPANWASLTPRVDAGPVWAQATITPKVIVVNANDGVTPEYSCKGPGTPIPPKTPPFKASPTCSMKFLQQTDGGTWPVAVHVSYSVTWTGFDGSTTVGGSLPALNSPPTTIPLAVLTAKPQLIDPNHD